MDDGAPDAGRVAAAPDRGAAKALLRFLVSGDDGAGASTLIGRLLGDADRGLADLQRALPHIEGGRSGEPGAGKADPALSEDGADGKRMQETASDIACRYFETGRRRFVVADIPGQERYTPDLVSGASAAAVAVLLVDAGRGVGARTRRHLCITALMGVKRVVLAVNKMDAVGYDEAVFRAAADNFGMLAGQLGFNDIVAIPVSARAGDNIHERSSAMPWYTGPSLLAYLEAVELPDRAGAAFRFPVQRVNGPDQTSRGLGGTVTGGRVSVGDRVKVMPGGREGAVARIVTGDGERTAAETGEPVTMVLSGEIGANPGDVIVAGGWQEPEMAVVDQLQAHLLWLGGDALVPGRRYRLRAGAADAVATVMDVKYRLDVDKKRRLAARGLALNEVGVVTLSLDHALAIDRFADNRYTGALALIDRKSGMTVAVGTVDHPLRRATNVVWHKLEIDKASRASAKGQKPMCVWFTGLSGAGKSTIANMVDKRLAALGKHAYVLDGDNVRHGLNRDLGFTEGDRVENIRRIAEVAKLMVDAGLIVLVCAISPFRQDREMARALFGDREFVEVFVSTPLEVCEARDPKGLYRKARAGEIPNFTGISAPYETPLSPDLMLTPAHDVTELAEQVVSKIL